MKYYRIVSSQGVDFGVYEAENEDSALDAMARDAGYKSQADIEARGIAPFEGTVNEVVRAHATREEKK